MKIAVNAVIVHMFTHTHTHTYIYIFFHPQTDCFVVSQLFRVAKLYRYYYILLECFFNISDSWGSFTRVSVKASKSKYPQVSRTLLSILVDHIKAVLWMVSTCLLISKSSSPFINPSVTMPRAPITIGINVTFMFHSCFDSLARSWYLSFLSLSFNYTLWSVGPGKSIIL